MSKRSKGQGGGHSDVATNRQAVRIIAETSDGEEDGELEGTEGG